MYFDGFSQVYPISRRSFQKATKMKSWCALKVSHLDGFSPVKARILQFADRNNSNLKLYNKHKHNEADDPLRRWLVDDCEFYFV
jgi:hypothetical protein